MGCIRWMSQAGDEKIEWDPEDSKSTEAAEKKFNELKDKGYDFFEAVQTKGKQIKKFSKKLGTIIAAPGAAKSESQRKGGQAMAGGPNHMRGPGLGGVPRGLAVAAHKELVRR